MKRSFVRIGAGAAGAVVWAMLGIPLPAHSQVAAAESAEPIVVVSPAGGGVQLRWHDDRARVELWSYGRVELNPDCTSVRSVSSGGYLILEGTRTGRVRRLQVTPDGNAGLVAVYTVDGVPEPRPDAGWVRESVKLLRGLRAARVEPYRTVLRCDDSAA